MDPVDNSDMQKQSREILSRDVDPTNEVESLYRIRLDEQVKYLLVEPNTFDEETLVFPPTFFEHLPPLPPGDWSKARICRNADGVSIELSHTELERVDTRYHWHPNKIDILSLTRVDSISPKVHLVKWRSKLAVAKFARFEFEISNLEQETAMYRPIDGTGIGPAFLGHLTENGRVMGFLIEWIEGTYASIGSLETCRDVVKRLHSLNILHGDVNRYNFLIAPTGATIIDFECATLDASKEDMDRELESLAEELVSESNEGNYTVDLPMDP